MKRYVSILLVLGFMGLCFPVPSGAQSRFAFKFTGGPNILDGGDLNAGAKGLFDYYAAQARSQGAAVGGSFSPAKLGPNLGLELIYRITDKIGLGLGFEMLSASKDMEQKISSGSSSVGYTHSVKASAVPLRLSVYYFLPASPRLNVFLKAGLGYYLASVFYSDNHEGGRLPFEIDASGSGLGFHGGLGLEISLSRKLGIVAECSGRFASFDGFTGTMVMRSGTLWTLDMEQPFGTFPVLFVESGEPSYSWFVNIRESKISITGFSFVVGAIVRI